MEIKVTDANTVTLTDNNYDLSSEVWHVSVMSSGVGNAPISLPTISTDTQVFGFNGIIKPTVGLSRWYPSMASVVSKFYASIETSSTLPLTLQLKKNGIAIGGILTIDAGSYKSNILIYSTAITIQDYLTVDIVSGNGGLNLFAIVALQSVAQYALENIKTPTASKSNLGFVKVGDGLNVDSNGVLTSTTRNAYTVFEDNHDFQAYKQGSLLSEEVIGVNIATKGYLMQGVGYARALVAPTLDAIFKLKVNQITICYISILAGSNVGSIIMLDSKTTISISAGDLLQIVAPAVPDATLADVAIAIGGSGALALSLPAATATTLGVVKVGGGLTVNSSGLISL